MTYQTLTIAIADVNDIVALDKLRSLVPHELSIETMLAGESEIARAIDQYYGHELSIDGILNEIERNAALVSEIVGGGGLREPEQE